MSSPFPRFVWFDADDLPLAESRINSLKSGQLSGWQWIRFDESSFSTTEQAKEHFFQQIWTPSLMYDGKVILIRGVPSFQKELGESLNSIPELVLIIMVADIRKDTVLYKRMIKWELGKIEQCPALDRESSKKFINEKAKELGIEIDPLALTAILALVGPNRNSLSLELKKLAPLAVQGKLMSWAVEEFCSGSGQAEVHQLCAAILKKEGEVAHVFLKRLLDRNENPLSIAAFMFDWIRKLAIADSCNGKMEEAKSKVSEALKWSASNNKSEPMFTKLGAFYYVCKDYNSARPKKRWAYRAMRLIGNLQIDLKKKEDRPEVLMHRTVEKLLKGVK